MSPNDAVGWVCQHQALVSAGAAWFVASIPASALAWLSSKWKACPPWLRAVLHALGANVFQAAEAALTKPPQPQGKP